MMSHQSCMMIIMIDFIIIDRLLASYIKSNIKRDRACLYKIVTTDGVDNDKRSPERLQESGKDRR